MAITSVADFLALGPEHAWITEGSVFATDATFASVGGGLQVGPLSLNPSATTITNWPDEIGSADLTVPTTAPYFSSSDAAFNNKPSVYCPNDGIARWMTTTFTNLGKDFEVVMVAKYVGDVGAQLVGGNGTFVAITTTAGPAWMIVDRSGGGNPSGGTPDTDLHMFRGEWARLGFMVTLYVDEVSTADGIWGNQGELDGLTAGSASVDGWAISLIAAFESGVLSATNRSDIQTWTQSHYGTP